MLINLNRPQRINEVLKKMKHLCIMDWQNSFANPDVRAVCDRHTVRFGEGMGSIALRKIKNILMYVYTKQKFFDMSSMPQLMQ